MKVWNYLHNPRAAMVLLRTTLALLMLCMSEKLNRTVAKRQEGEARKETAEQEAENA